LFYDQEKNKWIIGQLALRTAVCEANTMNNKQQETNVPRNLQAIIVRTSICQQIREVDDFLFTVEERQALSTDRSHDHDT
jgi:hypothetical protein